MTLLNLCFKILVPTEITKVVAQGGEVPDSWKDANFKLLFKGNGDTKDFLTIIETSDSAVL